MREVDAVEAVLNGEADVDEGMREVRDEEVCAGCERQASVLRAHQDSSEHSHPEPMRSTAPA